VRSFIWKLFLCQMEQIFLFLSHLLAGAPAVSRSKESTERPSAWEEVVEVSSSSSTTTLLLLHLLRRLSSSSTNSQASKPRSQPLSELCTVSTNKKKTKRLLCLAAEAAEVTGACVAYALIRVTMAAARWNLASAAAAAEQP
jgi:hypothetical protein